MTDVNTSVKAGTAGGTLLVLLHNIGADILHAALLSAVGAAVSYTVSFLLKLLQNRIKWSSTRQRDRCRKDPDD